MTRSSRTTIWAKKVSARRCGTILAEQERQPIPWYFKAMLIASVIYLGYRGYQGVTWIAGHV